MFEKKHEIAYYLIMKFDKNKRSKTLESIIHNLATNYTLYEQFSKHTFFLTPGIFISLDYIFQPNNNIFLSFLGTSIKLRGEIHFFFFITKSLADEKMACKPINKKNIRERTTTTSKQK